MSDTEFYLKKGDLVALKATATYYDGRVIPYWVKQKHWYVESVSGDRVVINESEDGQNAINSPVRDCNLEKCGLKEGDFCG